MPPLLLRRLGNCFNNNEVAKPAIYRSLWTIYHPVGRWMFSFFMRLRRVDEGKPKISAAPLRPLITQPDSSKTVNIWRRSFSSSVIKCWECGCSALGSCRAISLARILVPSQMMTARCIECSSSRTLPG